LGNKPGIVPPKSNGICAHYACARWGIIGPI
jgi:hypothetical protein